MELRRLQATDLFAMVRLLNAIGFNEFKTAINFDEIKEARKAHRKVGFLPFMGELSLSSN